MTSGPEKGGIGAALPSPIILRVLVRWARRRRGAFRRLAEEGSVQAVYIASIGSTALLAGLVGLGTRVRSSWVTIGATRYRALLRGTRVWAVPGVPIGVIAVPGVSYALFLTPDDEVLVAREHEHD